MCDGGLVQRCSSVILTFKEWQKRMEGKQSTEAV